MPKLPHLSGAQVLRTLERLGFHKARQSGSHVIMKSESNSCVVPMHNEVKVGTLTGILRQANIASEDFMQALRK
jgi:predicted RNA binding protein YcfA (HicA-like mRNA interferase family)